MIKYFKPSIFVLSTIPFLVITYKIFFNKLGPEPVKEITHFISRNNDVPKKEIYDYCLKVKNEI